MACIVCKGERINKLYDGYLECQDCGLVFLEKMPSQAELISRYVGGQISPIGYYEKTRLEDSKTFEKRLKLIKEYYGGKYLLDVGCNIGTLLEVAIKLGFEARGTDINFMCREYGKLKGLKIDHSMGDTLPYQHPFDVIVMNDVIEHVMDPKAFLLEIGKHLSAKGFVFVSTPDVGSLSRKVLKKRWMHFKPDEHLFYFNRQSFFRLAKEAGFRVLWVGKLPRYRRLGIVFNRLSRYVGRWVLRMPFANFIIPVNFRDEICFILTSDENK